MGYFPFHGRFSFMKIHAKPSVPKKTNHRAHSTIIGLERVCQREKRDFSVFGMEDCVESNLPHDTNFPRVERNWRPKNMVKYKMASTHLLQCDDAVPYVRRALANRGRYALICCYPFVGWLLFTYHFTVVRSDHVNFYKGLKLLHFFELFDRIFIHFFVRVCARCHYRLVDSIYCRRVYMPWQPRMK